MPPQGLLTADPGLAKGFAHARFLVLDESDRLLEPTFEVLLLFHRPSALLFCRSRFSLEFVSKSDDCQSILVFYFCALAERAEPSQVMRVPKA